MLFPSSRTTGAWLALGLCVSCCACATRPSSPDSTVRAYLAALEHDDPNAAYALLSRERQREVPPQQFLEEWRENREVALAQAAALRAGLEKGLASDARLESAGGVWALVASEPADASSAWRMSAIPSLRTSQAATPEEALRSFVQAVEAREWEAVSKLVLPGTREAVERELKEREPPLRERKPIEVVGQKAHVRYGRFELELERTGAGEWRVVGVR